MVDFKNEMYADTRDFDCYDYEDYKEFCELNDIEPSPKDSSDFFEWQQEEAIELFNCVMENIKHNNDCNSHQFVITFRLGLWDGDYDGVIHKVFDNLYAALDYVKRRTSCDDLAIRTSDGEVQLVGFHHDGRNVYSIHALSKKGEKAAISQYNRTGHLNPKDYWFKKVTWCLE